ncbi:MAG: hypothetical protein SCK57_01525 [Bacillota bacterium]|nr:hypothetical protein [Bacillota bacterium]MDW7676323.1 hypothetical protein [Bacillota bacterium]
MVFSLMIPLALLAVVVLIIAGVRNGSQQGGEEMIKNVYIYVVLFATLMMTIGGSVAAFMAVADIVAPAPYYQSFEDFSRWGMERQKGEETGETAIQSTEAEMRVQYDAMVQEETDRQINRAKNSLIKSLGWIVIPLPVFFFFSRKLRSRSQEA